MRTVLLFLASLFSTVVIAQASLPDNLFGGRVPSTWETSFSFSHRTNQRIVDLPTFREVDPTDIPLSMRQSLDTIQVSGVERFFRRSLPGEVFIDPSSPGFWFGTQLRVHRKVTPNLRLSAGIHYDQINYNSRDADGTVAAAGVVNTIEQVLYPVAEIKEHNLGMIFHVDYHLFAKARLHPFVGFGVSGLFSRSTMLLEGQIYSPEPEQIIASANITETITSTFDFDFLTTGGLLYRLNESWQVGITISSRIGNGSGILGGQIRYAL